MKLSYIQSNNRCRVSNDLNLSLYFAIHTFHVKIKRRSYFPEIDILYFSNEWLVSVPLCFKWCTQIIILCRVLCSRIMCIKESSQSTDIITVHIIILSRVLFTLMLFIILRCDTCANLRRGTMQLLNYNTFNASL